MKRNNILNSGRLWGWLGPFLFIAASNAQPVGSASIRDGWVAVAPPEFHGAINNPLKGFRDYRLEGYGLLKRQYIKWSEIEVGAEDTVERSIAHTKKITETKSKRVEDLGIKLVPRVYLDWNGSPGKQFWSADLHTFDYDGPAFQERLRRLVMKLRETWDDDSRIFAVQMGLIGHFGEFHNPAPSAELCRLLAEAFEKAFKNKPVLVRHNDAEFPMANSIMRPFPSLPIAAALFAVMGSTAATESPAVVRDLTPLQDATRVLVNPHKGWYHHYPDNHPNKYRIAHDADLLDFPGMEHFYIRLAWAYLDPQKASLIGRSSIASSRNGPRAGWASVSASVARRPARTESSNNSPRRAG